MGYCDGGKADGGRGALLTFLNQELSMVSQEFRNTRTRSRHSGSKRYLVPMEGYAAKFTDAELEFYEAGAARRGSGGVPARGGLGWSGGPLVAASRPDGTTRMGRGGTTTRRGSPASESTNGHPRRTVVERRDLP